MSTNPPEVFLNENETQVYLKNCKHHGLTEYYYKGNYCVLCNKTYKNEKLQQIIDYMGGKCVHCGYNKCNRVLDCHHLNPNEKEYTVAQMVGKKWSFIEQEIKKCILLCNNCHRIIHLKKEIKNTKGNKHNKKYRKLLFSFNNKKCLICKNTNIFHMCYHHIDPKTKKFNISYGILMEYSLERLVEENKKCVMLCNN